MRDGEVSGFGYHARPSPARSAVVSAPPENPVPASPWIMALLLAVTAYGLIAMTLCLPSMPAWGEIFAAPRIACN